MLVFDLLSSVLSFIFPFILYSFNRLFIISDFSLLLSVIPSLVPLSLSIIIPFFLCFFLLYSFFLFICINSFAPFSSILFTFSFICLCIRSFLPSFVPSSLSSFLLSSLLSLLPLSFSPLRPCHPSFLPSLLRPVPYFFLPLSFLPFLLDYINTQRLVIFLYLLLS